MAKIEKLALSKREKGMLILMRNMPFIFSIILGSILLLAGCGDTDGSSGNGSGGGSKDQANAYQEIESFDLEGYVVNMGFYLDETGDTLYWGEEETYLSNDELGRYVWVDGEVEELDMDVYDHSTMLSESGLLINNVSDFDREPNHSSLEYDPRTGEEEEFLVSEDYDDLIHVSRGRYLEDAKAYIHTITNADIEGIDTYIWDIESGEYTDLSIIEDLKEYIDEEFSLYPQFALTEDLTTVYAFAEEAGIFSYDIESAETTLLYEGDDLGLTKYGHRILTPDENHIIYRSMNYDETADETNPSYHGFNLETNEIVDIGEGEHLFTQSDGNIMFVDHEHVIHYFDLETEESEEVYTIELEENMELDNVTISSDGSTIAYGYTETVEVDDEEEEHFYLKVLSNN